MKSQWSQGMLQVCILLQPPLPSSTTTWSAIGEPSVRSLQPPSFPATALTTVKYMFSIPPTTPTSRSMLCTWQVFNKLVLNTATILASMFGLFSAKVYWPLRVNALKTIFFKELLCKPRINKHLNYKSHHVEQIGFLFINSKEAENKLGPKGGKWTVIHRFLSFFLYSIYKLIFIQLRSS